MICPNYSYQMAQGVSFEWMYGQHLYNQPLGCLIPDLTLYFRLSPQVALDRIDKRGNNVQAFENKQFLQKVSENYEKLVVILTKKDGRNIAIINANNNLSEVTKDTVKVIENFLKTPSKK